MAHPKRADHVEAMVDRLRLQGVNPLVSMDSAGEGAWANAKRAWSIGSRRADYQMVLQDDISFCVDFVRTAEWCAQLRDGAVVSFFLPRKSAEEAVKRGLCWVETPRFLWAQAVMMPTPLVDRWLEWCVAVDAGEAKGWNRATELHGDDWRLQLFLKQEGRKVYVPVPTLVEHEGAESSIIGNPNSARRRSRGFIGVNGEGMRLPLYRLDAVRE